MTTVDWENAPEGATHYDEHGGFYKCQNNLWHMYIASEGWLCLDDDDTAELDATLREIPAKPEPKKLTQAVFDGLPVEYRWAVVDASGLAFAAVGEMYRSGSGNFVYWAKDEDDTADFIDIGHGYDATDWKNSKIERVLICDAETLKPLADQAAAEAEMQREFDAALVKARTGKMPEELAAGKSELSQQRKASSSRASEQEIERLRAEVDELEWLKLGAESLVAKALYWAAAVRRNPDISRDDLLTMIADMEKHALIIRRSIKEQDNEN